MESESHPYFDWEELRQGLKQSLCRRDKATIWQEGLPDKHIFLGLRQRVLLARTLACCMVVEPVYGGIPRGVSSQELLFVCSSTAQFCMGLLLHQDTLSHQAHHIAGFVNTYISTEPYSAGLVKNCAIPDFRSRLCTRSFMDCTCSSVGRYSALSSNDVNFATLRSSANGRWFRTR